jgi:hypothetical protein
MVPLYQRARILMGADLDLGNNSRLLERRERLSPTPTRKESGSLRSMIGFLETSHRRICSYKVYPWLVSREKN